MHLAPCICLSFVLVDTVAVELSVSITPPPPSIPLAPSQSIPLAPRVITIFAWPFIDSLAADNLPAGWGLQCTLHSGTSGVRTEVSASAVTRSLEDRERDANLDFSSTDGVIRSRSHPNRMSPES